MTMLGPVVVGEANRVAVSALAAIATEEPCAFNLLIIQGGGGLAKSLMLREAGCLFATHFPQSEWRMLRADALRDNALEPDIIYRDDVTLRGIGLLLVDDIHLLARDHTAQHRLSHAMEVVIGAGGRVVLASGQRWPDIEDLVLRFVSKLHGAACVDIERPDREMRAGIIRGHAEDFPSLTLTEDLLAFLSLALPADGHIIAGAIKRLALYAKSDEVEPDLDYCRRTLDDAMRSGPRLTVAEIQERVAAKFHIPMREMTSQRRAREVARPRQVSMYLSKLLTPKSLPDIGRRHGGRDHTTVIHAIKQITKLREIDVEMDVAIRDLEAVLRA